MSRFRLTAGAIVAGVITWLILPQLFGEFRSVRDKIIRSSQTVDAEEFRVAIDAGAPIENLSTPLVAIIRLRNDAASALKVRIELDGRELCAAEIPAGVTRRLDCVIGGPQLESREHSLVFRATSRHYAIEYAELATHFGSITPGPRNLIVAPAGSSAFRGPSAPQVALVFILLALAVWSIRDSALTRPVAIAHAVLATLVVSVMAIAILSDLVSMFSVLISPAFLARLLVLVALPALWRLGRATTVWLARPTVAPVARLAAVGLLVAGVFTVFAIHLVSARFAGNPSGLVVISTRYFDKNPMVATRDDIRQSLAFSGGGGYDGQYLYFMAFDPFLNVYRNDPDQYREFIDFPPYRYGRIGFSLLTKVLSANDPMRYPITMVVIVIVSLGVCGVLLGAVAREHGFSALNGALVILVPGFWQSVKGSTPEPLAMAFILAAYLCLTRQRWLSTGVLLGMAMLVRETSGLFVLAALASVLLARKRREAFVVALLAFGPIVAWKCFVGWIFWSEYRIDGLMPHPHDVGLPFAGVSHMFTAIASGQYFPGLPLLSRAAVACAILTTCAFALALVTAVRRPSPVAAAALLYGVLTITFNYEAVWLHPGNADRLTVDLFAALAIVTFESARGRGHMSAPFVWFWAATALYVFFGAYEAGVVRDSILSLL